jgi:hypothetical protein
VIDYTGTFAFSASPSAVWATMEEVDQFERWWAWLGHLTLEGDGLRTGSVLRGTVTPPLPYRMRIRVEVVQCVPGCLIKALVCDDLQGVAQLALNKTDYGTDVDVSWNIEMMQTPMRVAARVAHPLMQWGHDRVVEATVKNFEAEVRLRHPRLGA